MMPWNREVRARRSILFVPGDRPDRYGKALDSGADSVCIDLEDAVGPNCKESARQGALAYLYDRPPEGAEVVLRINSPRSEEGLRDLLALRAVSGAPDGLMIPKVESAAEVRWVEGLLTASFSGVGMIPMIETPTGLSAIEEIAQGSQRIVGLVLGGVDLAAELGCTRDWDSLLYARSRLVHAAALAGVDAIDVPFLNVSDAEGLLNEAQAVRDLGFTGKAAIHPSQVAAIQEAFSPSAEEVERARSIVEAFDRNDGGVLLLDGALVERPIVDAALRTLAMESGGAREPGAS